MSRTHLLKFVALAVGIFLGFSDLMGEGTTVVHSADEFSKALADKNVSSIRLKEGEYEGNFTLYRGQVSLRGENDKVILKPKNKKKPVFSIIGPSVSFGSVITLGISSLVSGGSPRAENIQLTNMVFDGRKGSRRGPPAINEELVLIRNTDKLAIDGITVRDAGLGMRLRGNTNLSITNSKFQDNWTAIYTVDGTLHNAGALVITGTEFSGTSCALLATGEYDETVEIDDCKFKYTKGPEGEWRASEGMGEDFLTVSVRFTGHRPGIGKKIILSKNSFRSVHTPLFPDGEGVGSTLGTQYHALSGSYNKKMGLTAVNAKLISADGKAWTKEFEKLPGKLKEAVEAWYGLDDIGFFHQPSYKYIEWTLHAKRYLSSAMQGPESVKVNLENIKLAIQLLSFPPVDSWGFSEFSGKALEGRDDLLVELVKGQPFLQDYFLPAAWIAPQSITQFRSGHKVDIFSIVQKEVSIDGKDSISLVPEPSELNVEIFRTNLSIYKTYRENLSEAMQRAKVLLKFLEANQAFDSKQVKSMAKFFTSLESSATLGDKMTRIMYFDAPLWVIMAQYDAALKRIGDDADKVKHRGLQFCGFGFIAAMAIVGDSTQAAWKQVLGKFGKLLSGKDFKELKTIATTKPLWIKDTMSILLRASSFGN